MKQLEYSTEIKANPEKVWETLWDLENYKKWASSLNEGSYYEGDFSEGSIIKLFDPQRNGMYNLIEKNIPNQEMKMKHVGWIYDGELQPQGWEDSRESYILEPTENGTKLTSKVDAMDEFVDFYETKFPKMMERIKNLAEK